MSTLACLSSPSASSRTTFTCKTIGSRCKKKIAQLNDGLVGTVVNVFDNTINVKMSDNELLIISLGKVASPITVNIVHRTDTPDDNRRNSLRDFVLAGDQAFMVGEIGSDSEKVGNDAGQLSLGKADLLLDRPDYFENKIPSCNEDNLLNFLIYGEQLFYTLKECANLKNGCLLNPDMTTKDLLSEFLATVYDRADTIDIGTQEAAARLYTALLGLCGRGPGFTPAGDDFISGFLTIYNWICNSLKLGSPIIPGSEFLRLTTWTSFKLMEYNASELVDIEVQQLIDPAASGDVLSYADKVRSLSKRGHTSGIDFATGATFALYMAADSIIINGNTGKLVLLALKGK